MLPLVFFCFYVAGVDMGFLEDGKISRAAVAVLSFPDLQLNLFIFLSVIKLV